MSCRKYILVLLLSVYFGALHCQMATQTLLPIIKNGKWGVIDASGKEVIPPKFSKIETFINGEAVAYDNKKRGVINSQGDWIINPLYEKIEIIDFNGNQAYKVWLNNKCGLIDKNQERILSIKYEDISIQNDFFFAEIKVIGKLV